MKTKEFNKTLKGKDSIVNGKYIQQHLPECEMKVLQSITGHFIFCQKNHPVIVSSVTDDYNIREIEAEIVIPGDKIWIDNSIMFTEEELLDIQIYEPKDIVNYIFNKNIGYTQDILLGDSIENFRFKPNFYKYPKAWISKFLDNLIKESDIRKLQSNVVLLQQIKLLADRCNYYCDIQFKENKPTLSIKDIDIHKNSGIETKVSGFKEINDTITVLKYDGHVYDVKTDTQEFMISCMQTHNSFHLGGAASIKTLNILDELMNNLDESYRSTVKMMFKQDNDLLVLTAPTAVLEISKHIYVDKYKITKNSENKYVLPLGYFNIDVGGTSIVVNIEQETIVNPTDDIMEDDEKIIIKYNKNDVMFKVVARQIHPEKIASSLDELVGGKSPFNTPEELFIKIYKTLNLVGLGYDTVHLEVAISNILRNCKDPQKAARLVEPYCYQTFSVKTLPGVLSWPLGVAFENFNKAISSGLIADRAPVSPIEKIFFGEPLSKLANDQLKELRKKK